MRLIGGGFSHQVTKELSTRRRQKWKRGCQGCSLVLQGCERRVSHGESDDSWSDLWRRSPGFQAGSCWWPTTSITLGNLVSLDLSLSLWRKPGGLAETRDPQQASVIPPLAVKFDLSETKEASAPGQVTLRPVSACLEPRFPNTAFS